MPYDAIAMTKDEATEVAKIDLTFEALESSTLVGVMLASIVNKSAQNAIDLRLFVPHMRTVIHVPILRAKSKTIGEMHWRSDGDPKFGYGQAVLEFEDGSGHIFPQYADVDVRGSISRNLSQPFRVTGRIVAARAVPEPVY